jgi:hypothetical protein
MSDSAAITAEQLARDMLERMGIEDASSFSSGDVVELANLIDAVQSFTQEDVALLRSLTFYGVPSASISSIADRIAALLQLARP